MKSKKPENDNETVITAKWRPRVNYRRHGRFNAKPRRLVHTIGIKCFEAPELQRKIIEALQAGYEVRVFGKAVRLYHVVDAEYRRMCIAAQVLVDTPIRDCVKDIEFQFTRRGELSTVSEVEELEETCREEIAATRCDAEREEVTPDMLVTCPKCGNEFRVGKAMSK